MKLEYHPVTKETWGDFENLFESRGGPHNCWCTAWRHMTKTSNKANKAEKKASIKSLVDKGIHIGLLAYTDNEPIAWCSIAPRETYRPLDGVQTDRKVWSLACFFIKRPYRNLGLSNLLLTQAIQFAKRNGAQCVEAYPVDTDSPSYRFMGFVPTFEKAGFNFIKRTGKRRNVMLLDIK